VGLREQRHPSGHGTLVKMRWSDERRAGSAVRKAAGWRMALPVLLATLSVCLLAGCATDRPRAGDPFFGGALTGGPPAGPAPGSAAGPGAPLAPAPSAVPPAWPAATAAGSTAALASGPARLPDSRSGLQIGPASGRAAQPLTPPLRAPEPVARLTGNPPPPRVASYEQAQAVLLGRGVKWQRLEMAGDAGDWKFSCALPDKRNANISRTYEGKGPNYFAAMQVVLEQMDREGR